LARDVGLVLDDRLAIGVIRRLACRSLVRLRYIL
jgi:hypothetical protein